MTDNKIHMRSLQAGIIFFALTSGPIAIASYRYAINAAGVTEISFIFIGVLIALGLTVGFSLLDIRHQERRTRSTEHVTAARNRLLLLRGMLAGSIFSLFILFTAAAFVYDVAELIRL